MPGRTGGRRPGYRPVRGSPPCASGLDREAPHDYAAGSLVPAPGRPTLLRPRTKGRASPGPGASEAPVRIGLGLDFGTTNSAVAVARENGEEALARFAGLDGRAGAFRSLLFFPAPDEGSRSHPESLAGPAAIARHLEDEEPGRLIQSMKSFLASRSFTTTRVFDATFALEDLISIVIDHLRDAASEQLGGDGARVVVGRPVRFVNARDENDDAVAASRLESALRRSGFDRVELEYEPVAAAYHYEGRLERDELILIADFGGGTSDFSLLRVGPGQRGRPHHERSVLGTEGVPVAGDAFDGKIVRHLVAPRLGRDSEVESIFGKVLPVPRWLYTNLERWHHVSFLRSRKTLEILYQLRRDALEPDKLEALIHLVENDCGFRLYEAVQRAKLALSVGEHAVFCFRDDAVEIEAPLTRRDFETWIAAELEAIGAGVDRLLARSGVPVAEIDRVFMTGGSSLVPAVRRLFEERFPGADRIRSGEELTSVARGLALRALQPA